MQSSVSSTTEVGAEENPRGLPPLQTMILFTKTYNQRATGDTIDARKGVLDRKARISTASDPGMWRSHEKSAAGVETAKATAATQNLGSEAHNAPATPSSPPCTPISHVMALGCRSSVAATLGIWRAQQLIAFVWYFFMERACSLEPCVRQHQRAMRTASV